MIESNIVTQGPPETRGDYALEALRQALNNGILPPGKYLVADNLAARLGVSQIPIREALRFLEAQGLLVRDARGRVSVPALSVEEVEEVYAVRELLEASANRSGVPLLNALDIEAMEHELTAMEDALAVDDYPAYARANRSFHFVPFRRAGGFWRLKFLDLLWDAAARYQSALVRSGTELVAIRSQHAELLRAYRLGALDDIERLMTEHRSITVRATRSWLRGVVDG